jgi:hypothetical protein
MPTYLNRENKKDHSSNKIKEFPLPYDSDIIVRIKQQSIGRMNRFAAAQKQGNQKSQQEIYALISESVVDEVGDQVWEKGEIPELVESNCQLVSAIVAMIVEASGGKKQDVEEIMGNLNETE